MSDSSYRPDLVIISYIFYYERSTLRLPHRLKCVRTFPYIPPAACTPSSFAHSFLWSLLSRSYIPSSSLEVYQTNRETKVPLGNGLSRNADLGTAGGTGPTHGHSPVSFFGLELRRIWPAPTSRRCHGGSEARWSHVATGCCRCCCCCWPGLTDWDKVYKSKKLHITVGDSDQRRLNFIEQCSWM